MVGNCKGDVGCRYLIKSFHMFSSGYEVDLLVPGVKMDHFYLTALGYHGFSS